MLLWEFVVHLAAAQNSGVQLPEKLINESI
jgi:hypothetical protein